MDEYHVGSKSGNSGEPGMPVPLQSQQIPLPVGKDTTDTPAAEALSAARFESEAMPHLNDIYRTAARILGDSSRAEDVAQEFYLQAWKSFARFETGINCRAWLFKILFHCVNHHRRKWFRFPPVTQREEYLLENLAYSPPVAEHLTDAELLGRKFIHLALKSDSRLLSLVLTRKQEGESFVTEGLLPVEEFNGVPVYRAAAQRFEIAAFESGEHLAYVISDLPRDGNLKLMLALTPDVKELLSGIES